MRTDVSTPLSGPTNQHPHGPRRQRPPRAADARIDDHHERGAGREVRRRRGEVAGRFGDVVRGDVVGEVDERGVGAHRERRALHRPDVGIPGAEVREERQHGARRRLTHRGYLAGLAPLVAAGVGSRRGVGLLFGLAEDHLARLGQEQERVGHRQAFEQPGDVAVGVDLLARPRALRGAVLQRLVVDDQIARVFLLGRRLVREEPEHGTARLQDAHHLARHDLGRGLVQIVEHVPAQHAVDAGVGLREALLEERRQVGRVLRRDVRLRCSGRDPRPGTCSRGARRGN